MFKTLGPLDLEKDNFVGRVQELTQMRKWVESAETYGLILGASQTGKTSLLLKLQADLQSKYTCVYLDLQPFGDLDQRQMYRHLSEQIVARLHGRLEKKEWPPVDYGLAFVRFLRQILEDIDSPRVVFLLDEIDALSQQSLGSLAGTIRGIFFGRLEEHGLRKCVFIYAAATDVLTLAERRGSPLRNITECLYLEDLSCGETIQLLEHRFTQEGIQVKEAIAEHIHGWTHGHPYLTQALGDMLVEMKQQGGDFRLTKTSVDKAVQRLQIKGDPNLRRVANVLERAKRDSPVLLEMIRDVLESRSKIRFSRTAPEILQLELMGIVREGEDGYCAIRNQIYQQILQNVDFQAPPLSPVDIRTGQIFLSYAREDAKKVEDLYQKLSAAGFKPWMAIKDILPGQMWRSSIREAIRRSDFFLACLSANSVSKRGLLQKEINEALDIWQEMLDSDIYLIPVRLDECEVPETLRDFQWVDLFEEDGWIWLMEAIQVGMAYRAEVLVDEEPLGRIRLRGKPLIEALRIRWAMLREWWTMSRSIFGQKNAQSIPAQTGFAVRHFLPRHFLAQAGFAVQPTDPYGFLCTSNLSIWADLSPLYVRLVLERALDLEEFQALCKAAEAAYGEDLRGHAAAVLIDRPPHASDLHQIFALRAQRGLIIIPLPRSLIVQARRDGREMEALREQVDLYIGRTDLYDARGAVIDVLSFFGRNVLLASLEQQLTSGRSVVVFGMRKVGKSSLLGRLREECDWPVALVDLQGYAGGLQYVYGEALHGWRAAIQATFPDLSLPEWRDDLSALNPAAQARAFHQTVGNLLSLLADQPRRPGLLLFLDEIDNLFGQSEYPEFAAVLRSVAEDPHYRGRFVLLVAGLEPALNRVDRMHGGRNPFYAFFGEVSLGPLELEDTQTMIVSIGGQMEISYEDEALDLLVETGGGHPFLTRQLCSQAIRELERPTTVDVARAIQAIEAYLRRPRNYLAESLWGVDNGGPSWVEAALLRSLAAVQPQPEAALIPPDLSSEERRTRQLALDHLRDQSLIRRVENGWELTIPLYRRWIRRYILNLPDQATAEGDQ